MSDEYRMANDMEFAECNCDENYELLVGPAGWQCLLTEPEDRRWHRDLEPVVAELNRLHAEVERLRLTDAEREAMITVRDFYISFIDHATGERSIDDSCLRIAKAVDNILARHGVPRRLAKVVHKCPTPTGSNVSE